MIEVEGDAGEFSARVAPEAASAQFPTLPPGDYVIRIRAEGFEEWRSAFTVVPARAVALRVRLVPDEQHYRNAVSSPD